MRGVVTETVLIIDFGSQVTQLIARRVREHGVYSEIVPFNRAADALERLSRLLSKRRRRGRKSGAQAASADGPGPDAVESTASDEPDDGGTESA